MHGRVRGGWGLRRRAALSAYLPRTLQVGGRVVREPRVKRGCGFALLVSDAKPNKRGKYVLCADSEVEASRFVFVHGFPLS